MGAVARINVSFAEFYKFVINCSGKLICFRKKLIHTTKVSLSVL